MSRIVRAPDGALHSSQIVPGEIFDARREAARILSQAAHEAEQTRKDAATFATRAREQAEREGMLAAESRAATILSRATAAFDGALAAAEAEAVALALSAARRVVDAELALAPERIVDIVRGALARAARARNVVVHLHPDDVAAATDATAGDLAARFGRPIRLEPDAGLSRGDCVVVSELGRVDARIDVKLESLGRAIERERGATER